MKNMRLLEWKRPPGVWLAHVHLYHHHHHYKPVPPPQLLIPFFGCLSNELCRLDSVAQWAPNWHTHTHREKQVTKKRILLRSRRESLKPTKTHWKTRLKPKKALPLFQSGTNVKLRTSFQTLSQQPWKPVQQQPPLQPATIINIKNAAHFLYCYNYCRVPTTTSPASQRSQLPSILEIFCFNRKSLSKSTLNLIIKWLNKS